MSSLTSSNLHLYVFFQMKIPRGRIGPCQSLLNVNYFGQIIRCSQKENQGKWK